MNTEQLTKRVCHCITICIAAGVGHGLSYREGLVMARALVFAMEEIDRQQDIDEDFMAGALHDFVLNQVKELT